MQKVEIVDYQKSWIDMYNAETDALKNSIGFLDPDIHHIGSTSVPGLSAKPIIDILIEVDDVGCLDDHKKCPKQLGIMPVAKMASRVEDTSRRVVIAEHIRFMRLTGIALALCVIWPFVII